MDSDELGEPFANLWSWLASADRQNAGTYTSTGSDTSQPNTLPHFAITRIQDSGHRTAVVAAASIALEETLITIGPSDLLSPETSQIRTHISKKELDVVPPWLALVTTLMYETGQNGESRWWPFLALLPTKFDTLMCWSNEELQTLTGSHVLTKIGKSDAEQAFKDTLFPLLSEYSNSFGLFKETFSTLTDDSSQNVAMELAHRFATIVSMHSIEIDDDDEDGPLDPDISVGEDGFVEERNTKGMMPFLDLIRSDPIEANVKLVHNENGSFSIVSTTTISAGEELVQDPGELPNGEFLRIHGAITQQRNPFNVAELDYETILDVSRSFGLSPGQFDKREALADRWGILVDGYDLMRSPTTDGLDQDLLLVTHLFTLESDDEFKEMKASKKMPPGKLDTLNAQLLLRACEQRQKRYPTTLAEDIAILGSNREHAPQLPNRQNMAIEVRLGEKEVLADHIAYLRGFLATGAELEEVESRSAKRQKISA